MVKDFFRNLFLEVQNVASFNGLCPPEPLAESFAGGGKWKRSANSSDIYTYKFNMSSSLGTSSLWIPWTWALPLDSTGASSQTILQARSTTLAQISPSYIKPSRSLLDSVLLYNHICTIEENTKICFIQCIWLSDIRILISGMNCLSMFPLPRRCQFSEDEQPFIPSCLPWIHYTPTIKVQIY